MRGTDIAGFAPARSFMCPNLCKAAPECRPETPFCSQRVPETRGGKRRGGKGENGVVIGCEGNVTATWDRTWDRGDKAGTGLGKVEAAQLRHANATHARDLDRDI
eukprot:3107701-Rhodomonas_salina.1